jgi:hypothetical protein
MNIDLPIAVRATAAAFAVFMTTTVLNGMVSLAGPDQNLLAALRAERDGVETAAIAARVVIVAQATTPEHQP